MKYLLISLLFIGCVPQSKLAKVCAERYPVKEEIREIVLVDTLNIKGDTIRLNKTDTAYVICPPTQVITKIKEVRITAENTAKTHLAKEQCSKELKDKDKEIIKLQNTIADNAKKISNLEKKLHNVQKYKRRFFILTGILTLFLFFKFSRWFKLLPF
jgi:predicted RNase H-like nuclease (RuvC/YqgF family)